MKDLADKLGVKLPTVSSAIFRLARLGLVKHEKRGYVTLTEKGKSLATALIDRHAIVKKFLVATLRLSEEKASQIACKIEHFLDDEVIESMEEFLTNNSNDMN